jgi:hypothetical protein
MTNIVDSVNAVLDSYNEIEKSDFYKKYLDQSKEYDSLIEKGLTKKRESQMASISDKANMDVPVYNKGTIPL